MTRRKALLAAAAIGLAAQFSTSVPAQAAGEPPCSTAKLIVPWGAGGDTYVIFQIFEEAVNRLSPKHKIQLVTVPGQGGNKGAKEAAKAKADGCTLFAIHQSALISYLNGRIDFTWDKFEPVAHLTSTPEVFAASGKAPWKTFKEMLAEAKAKPDTVKVGATFGSTSQFGWLILEDMAGVKFKYIPFDGTAQRATALLSNTVQLGTTNVTTSGKHFESGELKPLVLADVKRSKRFPNMPTMKELGIDMTYALNRGIMAPKGTPKATVAYWASVFEKAIKDPALVKQFSTKETDLIFLGPAAYGAWWKKEYDRHEKIAIKIGMFKKKK
ncbi:MAG: tripartite tricarboxylate transporter substrate binding protein [Hyphomicrobiaceae bacterium]|nr:tripartite tricarboxylate transporter substrate binding protein [Hyphomicrobiaceae bacterium]